MPSEDDNKPTDAAPEGGQAQGDDGQGDGDQKDAKPKPAAKKKRRSRKADALPEEPLGLPDIGHQPIVHDQDDNKPTDAAPEGGQAQGDDGQGDGDQKDAKPKPAAKKKLRSRKADALPEEPLGLPDIGHQPIVHELDAKAYWIGSTKLSPRHYWTIAGITAPNMTEHIVPSEIDEGVMDRLPQKGALAYLTDEQVEAFKHAATSELVVRMDGRGLKSPRPVLNRSNERYRARRYDHPAACYVWLLPWVERQKYMTARGANEPPTLLPVPEEVLDRLSYEAPAKRTPEQDEQDLVNRYRGAR